MPPAAGHGQLVEHTYERRGAVCYLAAWDVRRGRAFGRAEPGGIEPFDRLVRQVMTKEPYASAPRVFWIVDNGSSHRGQRSVERLEGRWANLRLVHLPVHALNPILRGWTSYHRHAVSKRCFNYLDHYLWWRVVRWLRKKHPRLTWGQVKRRYWGRNWTSPDGTRLYWPGRVPVTRYRYRGHRIPTPWAT